ncbi:MULTISPECIES: NAD(P)-dependent oxidoreductase [unclassified Fusibacter]|uniref:NAD(P)-dependent oxidoreductase n=1 Tax=unclassified Fusibacter TaxID=2624464 RepID=UPI001010F0E8|nr:MULTISPECIES: NAD(P)-dependent oxidoreductase [unclassified Fusibacter]MCK8058528.1 NAD(P)-dependent oxidoreductase [Fusibacter sp. A2]NPE22703.1 NAD(P)-dependent oxidoreductase [Fusibacter sp. A1]RXV60263.1 NAD(P)-dependent oxidoreductase [Fusibacter sp. A1]
MSRHEILEAKRCLQCKNALCIKGCPVSTDIPAFISYFKNNRILEAGKLLFENNPLSVVCSLICPHERQCEGYCVLNKKEQPIHISSIENYISDYYLTVMDYQIKAKNSEQVAIIGAGPAGLTIAMTLAIKGYQITIFEANDKIGGVLRYGVPEFRLPKSILDRIHDKLIALGVVIRPNTLIGPNLTLDNLFEDGYDAVFIGTGVWKPNKLKIKGESLGNVHYGLDYLKNPNVYALGDNVCVIGAGNAAMDVARTALRNGSRNVSIVYRKELEQMPANEQDRLYAQADGVKFEFNKLPVELTREGIKYIKTYSTEDSDGALIWHEDPSSTGMIEASSIIIAVSQGPRDNIVSNTKDIGTNKYGLVITDDAGRTTREGVFASGDVVTGAMTVVEAVKYSKLTSNAIEEYLTNKTTS